MGYNLFVAAMIGVVAGGVATAVGWPLGIAAAAACWLLMPWRPE